MSRPTEPLPPDLEDAVHAFAHWRRTRRTATGATPEPLRRRAVALLGVHRVSVLANTLGLNPTSITRWAADTQALSASAPPVTAFVTLDGTASERAIDDAARVPVRPDEPGTIERPELVLRWPGGAELVARGAVPHAALASMLEAFDARDADATMPQAVAR